MFLYYSWYNNMKFADIWGGVRGMCGEGDVWGEGDVGEGCVEGGCVEGGNVGEGICGVIPCR